MSASETAELLVDKAAGVTRLVINREERRNALSPSLLKELIERLDEAESDPETRVVCITGAGQKAFCSGADLMASLSGEVSPEESSAMYAKLLQRMLSFNKPTVARLNGHAMGGGVGVALAADIAIAREGILFGTPEVKVGLFPMMIAPLILRNMPLKRAMQMILCGERMDVQEALSFGLLNKIVPADALDAEVDQMLEKLCAAAPLAQQRGKQALREIEGLSFDDAVTHLSGHLAFLMQTEDASEGISAFFQKRTPEWKAK